jgi:hypothetical protein
MIVPIKLDSHPRFDQVEANGLQEAENQPKSRYPSSSRQKIVEQSPIEPRGCSKWETPACFRCQGSHAARRQVHGALPMKRATIAWMSM